MKRFTLGCTVIAVLALMMTALPVSAQSKDVRTAIFVVPGGTNSLGAANIVALENTGPLYSEWTPVSVLQNIGTTTGAASTNTTTMAYRPRDATKAYRIGGITAQTYGTEALAVLTGFPPLKNGDKLELQGTALSNLTFFVTYELTVRR